MGDLEYNARVHVKSKVHYFPLIKDRLGLERSVLFRQTRFGRWLDLTYVHNEEDLVHYMLQKQKFSDDDHYDLPLIYNVNGHSLHFGRREFCLISGFRFGMFSFRKFRDGDITFRDRVFPEKIGEYVKNIDLLSMIEDEARFTSLSDSDAIRVCLLLSLEVVFMGHDLGSNVDDVFLRMVEDIDAWDEFAWGEYLWRELYASIRNVNSKNKVAHRKAMEKNPNSLPTYSLSGFILCFKIWILETSSVTDRWWIKDTQGIPRGAFWSKQHPFQKWDCFAHLFPKDKKPNLELYPRRAEAQSKWFVRSTDFFKFYTPRAPPVEYHGLFGDYLKKVEAGRARMQKERSTIDNVPKVVTLEDHVMALEGLCSSLMILPKEIKSLKCRIYKLETIFNALRRKKVALSQQRHKDDTSIGDQYWGDEDGEIILNIEGSPKPSPNKGVVNDLVDALDELVDQNGDVEHDKLEQPGLDDFVLAQKLEAEKYRCAEQKKQRNKKLLQEQNNYKSRDFSTRLCGSPNKRKYVTVVMPPIEVDNDEKVLNMDKLRRQKNVLDEFMMERCQDLKPWKEDLKRTSECIDKIYMGYYLEQFLISSGWKKCKFPWCKDIVVGRSFWDTLIGLDDGRQGWLLDDHIELWIWYMWHFRKSSDDWSMVSCYFLTLLLQDSWPLFYATDEIYPLSWKDVEQVFIPINEPKRHWSLAQFHIQSGNVTFYNSQQTDDFFEFRPWYLKMRSCLESKLPVMLQQTGVFASRGIDPESYRIKFSNADLVPRQGGLFGDCGVFVCLFLYRLAHGIPLVVDDPVQTALAYREKMIQFFFKNKIIHDHAV